MTAVPTRRGLTIGLRRPYSSGMTETPVQGSGASEPLRRDAQAARAARIDLGSDYDDAIASGLADRMEELAAYRTAELRAQDERARREIDYDDRGRTQRFVLGVVSLGAAIPITGIAAGAVDPGVVGVALVWAGIVGVNAVYALSGRRPRR